MLQQLWLVADLAVPENEVQQMKGVRLYMMLMHFPRGGCALAEPCVGAVVVLWLCPGDKHCMH